MTEKEEYQREVRVIALEKDNKRLLRIYHRGEEKDRLLESTINIVSERVSYALSSSVQMDLLDRVPTLEERIRYFFEEYYFDNVPTASKSDIRYYIEALKRFLVILHREGEIDDDTFDSLFSMLFEYL